MGATEMGRWAHSFAWLLERVVKPDGEPPALEDCVRCLQRGESAALERLIRATHTQAFRVAYTLLGDRHLCEDVLQDVYLTVYRKIEQLREPQAFRGWFRRIVVHECHRHLRRRGSESLDDQPEAALPQTQGHDSVDTTLAVRQAFGQMSGSDRTVLAMREMLDLSYEEIADTLEVPVSTVKSRLFKARKRFLDFFSGGPS
jgi:RNA polymerase sigma factor (sigma-70 family)